MGLFNRHKEGKASGNRSEDAHDKNEPVMESVRKADGSTVTEAVVEYDEKGEKSDFSDDSPPLQSGKTLFTGSSYALDPSRGDSFASPRKQSMVMQDMLTAVNKDDQYEDSFHNRRKWRSSRMKAGEVYEKPWVNEKDPRKKWEKIIFAGGCLGGCMIGAYLLFSSWTTVTNSEYCSILEDNFTSIDESIWNYEIERGGFGVGSFEWTTNDPTNVYVDNDGLHIVPTLTNETTFFNSDMIDGGAVLNLTADAVCTSDVDSNCAVQSNTSSGNIINPVRSARINTMGKRAIRYGKVEVEAKLPAGDWIWPAIWMMPQDSVYGAWPQSGEIDIMEARGNSPGLPSGGRDQISSSLHWGPNSKMDAYFRTLGINQQRRTDFSQEFHTFGLEWNSKYMFMYLDSRLLQVFFIKWVQGESMWDKGKFGTGNNQSALNDPWSYTGRPNTPFDQEFYLILNVAIGGTNGFFVDGQGNKPWVDGSDAAPRAFWDAVGSWYPTWGPPSQRGMTVRSVKMWSLGKCLDT